jgi:hypothetical protein
MRTSRSQYGLVECLVIALGAVLGLLWGLEQAIAWVLGGLILLGALTAQRAWSERKPDRVGQSVIAKWLVIALGFSVVFSGWNAVPLALLILGALAVNLAGPISAVIVAMNRRRY